MKEISKPYAKALELNDTQQASLRALVGIMIPASVEFDVPGADDDAIFSDLLATGGTRKDAVLAAIEAVETAAMEQAGAAFASLPVEPQQRIANALRQRDPTSANALADVTVRC